MAELGKIDVTVTGEVKHSEQAGTHELQSALARIHGGFWAMDKRALPGVIKRAGILVVGEDEPAEPVIVTEPPAANEAKVPRLAKAKGSVAVIPIRGVIGQHRGGDYWADVYTEVLSAQISSMVANPSIGAIVLAIDSPGGIVYGTPELADSIRAARDVKPIYSVADGMAASAGYWIGSSATKMFVTPSGEVGSIGVWSAHADFSKAYAEAGIKMTIVSSSEFKTEGNPWEPLTEAGEVDMQASVNRYDDMFHKGVAAGTGVKESDVRANFGKGRLLGAEAAKAAGMVDGIATVNEVLAGIMNPKKTGSRLAMASADLRLAEVE